LISSPWGPRRRKRGRKPKRRKVGAALVAAHTLFAHDALVLCNGPADDGAENGGVLSAEEQAKLFQSANRSLQMQLAERHEVAVKTLESKRELQERVSDLQKDFERERKETFGITQDMTRQYKSMQEELLNRVNTLENTNTELRDQLGASDVDAWCSCACSPEDSIVLVLLDLRGRAGAGQLRGDEARQGPHHRRQEPRNSRAQGQDGGDGAGVRRHAERDVGQDACIEITNTSFENDGGSLPMMRRLEEFNLGSPTKS